MNHREVPRPGIGAEISDAEQLEGFTHLSADADGIRIHAVVGGSTGSDPVVLLAGFPQTWYAWHKVMPALARHHRVIALDLPGQGLSDRPADGYDTETAAARVHEAVVRLAGGRYWLFAHDIGSWVAFTYALRYADELAGLALLDAGIPGVTLPETLPLNPAGAWKMWHFAFHQVPDLPEVLLEGKEREYVSWFLRAKTATGNVFDGAEIDLYTKALIRDGGLHAAMEYYRAVPESAARNRRLLADRELTMPVLAIDSEHGSIPDMAAPLTPFVPHVRRASIAGAGHFIPDEQPAALAQILLRFANAL
ncbi:alpha/beta fold hydrolase [Streptomyces violaceusniger]|uniref:Hydrolase n=1 Tax=Streptomyces violaceusniger TaxID=68280 RepID=A0A4D4LDP7_STRVO|nr:hydrolase [Streptomyces violaceusniger]